MSDFDLKIFASRAESGELAAFPDIERGWGITKNNDLIPTLQEFNGAFNRVDTNMRALIENGIMPWQASVSYPAGAIVQTEGVLYQAIKAAMGQNTSNRSYWKTVIPAPQAASTSQAGVVQLSDSTSSTASTTAATSAAVKKAYDAAAGAQRQAQQASSAAQAAGDKATQAKNTADTASSVATQASAKATQATSSAQDAVSKATQANRLASEASGTATLAKNTADGAATKAQQASDTATAAQSTAQEASTTAQSALTKAQQALDSSASATAAATAAPVADNTYIVCNQATTSVDSDFGIKSQTFNLRNGTKPYGSKNGYGLGVYLTGSPDSGTNLHGHPQARLYFPHCEGGDTELWVQSGFDGSRKSNWTKLATAGDVNTVSQTVSTLQSSVTALQQAPSGIDLPAVKSAIDSEFAEKVVFSGSQNSHQFDFDLTSHNVLSTDGGSLKRPIFVLMVLDGNENRTFLMPNETKTIRVKTNKGGINTNDASAILSVSNGQLHITPSGPLPAADVLEAFRRTFPPSLNEAPVSRFPGIRIRQSDPGSTLILPMTMSKVCIY